METRIIAVMLLLGVSACAMPGQTDPNESFWGSYYGTEKSEDEKEKSWWDGFYGKKSADADSNCSFYNTCKSDAPAAGGGWYGTTGAQGGGTGGGWGVGPSDSVSGSDAGSGP